MKNQINAGEGLNYFVVGIIILAGFSVFGFGGYYFGKQSPQPVVKRQDQPIPSQVPTEVDPTANWELYRNEKYGYEIKYPSGWYLEKMPEMGVGGVDQLYSYKPPEIQVKDPNFFKGKANITLGKMIQPVKAGQTLAGWIEEYEKNLEGGSVLISQANLIFTGQNAIKQIRDSYEGYFIEKNNEIYFISVGGELTPNLKIISTQILSTFKFLGEPSPTTTNDEETEVRNLITQFEKYIQDRNINALMALFTPAKTKEEIESYQSLMGLDAAAGPRLFSNVSSNFLVISWKIARREYPDNKELITKDNNKYFVTVEETRKSWCNTDPCAGTYSFEHTSLYVFELANVNSRWMVDKYYLLNQRNVGGGPKYEALGF